MNLSWNVGEKVEPEGSLRDLETEPTYSLCCRCLWCQIAAEEYAP